MGHGWGMEGAWKGHGRVVEGSWTFRGMFAEGSWRARGGLLPAARGVARHLVAEGLWARQVVAEGILGELWRAAQEARHLVRVGGVAD